MEEFTGSGKYTILKKNKTRIPKVMKKSIINKGKIRENLTKKIKTILTRKIKTILTRKNKKHLIKRIEKIQKEKLRTRKQKQQLIEEIKL